MTPVNTFKYDVAKIPRKNICTSFKLLHIQDFCFFMFYTQKVCAENKRHVFCFGT